MIKKKSKNNDQDNNSGFDLNKTISNLLKTLALGMLKEKITETVSNITKTINDSIINLLDTIGKMIFSGIIFLFGFIFLIFSFILLTKDYFNLSLGWSLFIWAFIMMIFSLIYGFAVMNKKNNN